MEAEYPLTWMQAGMVFHSVHAPHSGAEIEQVTAVLRERLDDAAFHQAWRRVVARHDVLRTSVHWEELAKPMQRVHSEVDVAIARHDWREEGAREALWTTYLESDRVRDFELQHPPLIRLGLFRFADEEYRLVWTFHHVAMDGRSVTLLLQEVFHYYQVFRDGRDLDLPLPARYYDHVRWMESHDWRPAENFWRNALAGFVEPTTLRVETTTPHPGQGSHTVQLTPGVTAELDNFARRQGVSLHTVVQGAWALVLSRYSGNHDVVFGSTRACRHDGVAGADGMIGVLFNTVPFRVKAPGATLFSWLRSIRQQQVAIREYEQAPLVEIRRWSGLPGSVPLFSTLLVFENSTRNRALRGQGGEWERREFDIIEQSDFPLSVCVYGGPAMSIKFLWKRNSFDEDAIGRLALHLCNVLEAMPGAGDVPLSQITLVNDAERRKVVVEWNRTTTDYAQRSLQELFEEQVDRAQDAIALEFEDQHVSYAELNRRANQVAHWLRERGVGPDIMVGLCAERGIEMLAGMLAIVKAGGAYVPLDPSYPPSRLAFMLEDTATTLVLTQNRYRHLFAATTLCLDSEFEQVSHRSTANPAPSAGLDHLAYLIYTSGSTGQPKAALIPQRGVVRLVKATNYVNLTSDEVILQFAPISFDASTFEIWGALLNGGRLVVFPAHTPSLEELGRVIRERGITTLWLTAALFHQMIEQESASLTGLRQLLAGGEALSAWHVREAQRRLPGCRLINGYGPTENTTFTCCADLSREEISTTVPIGRPIANTRVYILDSEGQPVPVGVPGELSIAGDGLARGYWRRPELTAERFIESTLDPAERLYRTGDLVRWRTDGQIEFLGRMDQQVKIRGFRVEPGEIEAALLSHPGVRETTVMLRHDTGDKRLVAYFCGPASAAALRDYLRERLPEYMMPSAFVPLESLPLNANGKIDRHALPAPAPTQPKQESRLLSPVEARLASLWSSVLGVDVADPNQDFFEAGGDSLLAMQLISRVRSAFDVNLSIRRLFDAPTIAGFAQLIETAESVAGIRDNTPVLSSRAATPQQ